MRDGFRDIVSGWMLVMSFDAVTERIEASAAWVKANGGYDAMHEDEKSTIEMMIETQMALAKDEGIIEGFR